MLSTWIVETTFSSMPDAMSMAALKVAFRMQKRYSVGTFSLGPNHLIFIMASDQPVQPVQPQTMLRSAFRNVGMVASIGQFEAFTPYHLELMGVQSFVPNKEESDSDVETEAICKAWDVETGRDGLAEVTANYFKNREATALALRHPVVQVGGEGGGPRITWCTDAPSQLEVATERTLREHQKLDWVLLRDPSLGEMPTVEDFARFFKIYKSFSTVDDDAKLIKQAYVTFSKHVHTRTGKDISSDPLPVGVRQAVRKIQNDKAVPLRCQKCDKFLKIGWIMDSDGMMTSTNRHGVFCDRACQGLLCKGCGGPKEDDRCQQKCGKRVPEIRMATWFEYYEWLSKHARNSWTAEYYKKKAAELTEEKKNEPKERLSYGGFFHVYPDAF